MNPVRCIGYYQMMGLEVLRHASVRFVNECSYLDTDSHLGVVIKASGWKLGGHEFYSYLVHKASWVLLGQSLYLSPRKETIANLKILDNCTVMSRQSPRIRHN